MFGNICSDLEKVDVCVLFAVSVVLRHQQLHRIPSDLVTAAKVSVPAVRGSMGSVLVWVFCLNINRNLVTKALTLSELSNSPFLCFFALHAKDLFCHVVSVPHWKDKNGESFSSPNQVGYFPSENVRLRLFSIYATFVAKQLQAIGPDSSYSYLKIIQKYNWSIKNTLRV